MIIMKKAWLLITILYSTIVSAQHLKPGFDKTECIELLKMGASFGDSIYQSKIPVPEAFKMIYRSPIVGMDNLWELWVDNNGVAVISLRGTTQQAASWLENFYAAMVPAKGELHLSDSLIFRYELASNPKAAVHVGWLLGAGFLSYNILPKIDSLYKSGIKEFIITGHSQGGALSFLITSWLYSLQKQKRLAGDIRFKTYSFAGPKVGNLYYAYDYEAMTQYGWAYNVVNSADWVPEVMYSIQTPDDFNNTNPFADAKELIGKLPFPKDLVLKYLYNQMDAPIRKAEYRFQDCLGKGMESYVKKAVPGFQPPVYYNSMDYVRVGNTIVLLADDDYYKLFPDSKTKIFVHHLHPAYLYLAQKLPATGQSTAP
jgi:Lipase (class 3)